MAKASNHMNSQRGQVPGVHRSTAVGNTRSGNQPRQDEVCRTDWQSVLPDRTEGGMCVSMLGEPSKLSGDNISAAKCSAVGGPPLNAYTRTPQQCSSTPKI